MLVADEHQSFHARYGVTTLPTARKAAYHPSRRPLQVEPLAKQRELTKLRFEGGPIVGNMWNIREARKAANTAAEPFSMTRVPNCMKVGVLIVEDEPLLRSDAVDFFIDAGFTVYEAANADDAIARLELHDDIPAVFSDIHMPGSMDGLKLAHYVRGRWPPVELIITSGLANPRAQDMPVGSHFVSKPYQLEKVAINLRAMIG